MTFVYTGILVFYSFALIVLALFGLHKYYLIYLNKKYRANPEPELPDPEEWPEVVVQLPIYNERYVVKRLLRSVAQLDYPKDKLRIQVLDDSNDKTVELTRRLVKVIAGHGFRIEHVRRPDRVGFKAGALEYGLQRCNSEFIAIFDADFVPGPEFLRRTLPHLVHRPEVGLVQTRWGHLNRDYSLLTRLQGLFLDAHFMIEHYARNRSGKFFNFNGTAGIWRRQAIIDAGGWHHDTLTEDLDLSYRAQIAGWRFHFLPEVVTPAELPVDMNAYKSQQHRWAKGSVQTAIKLLPHILKSHLPWYIKLEAFVHLGSNFAYLLMAIPAIFLIPILHLQLMHAVKWTIIPYIFMFFAATFSVIYYYAYSIRLIFGKLWPHITYIPALMGLGIGLSVNNGKAVLEALLGFQTDFLRTPKFRIESKRDAWKNKIYKPVKTRVHFAELMLALYFTLGMGYFFINELYFSIPFFALFQFGFFYIALSSYGQGSG